MTANGTLVIDTGIRTVNPLNRREHYQARARRAKAERNQSLGHLLVHRAKLPPLPVVVTLTRQGPRLMDAHDGLRASLKHVVDGIADAYGVKDDDPRIRWEYAPQQKQKDYGVRICIAKAKGARP